MRSTTIAPVRGAYGSTRNVSTSGTRRISPTGPIPSTGWSWSSAFIACIATVRPMPLVMRPSSPCRPLAFARTVPSLPHQRKRTSRSPASSASLTTSAAATYPTVGVAAAELGTRGSIHGATRSEIITRSFSAAIAPPDSS